MRIYGNRKIETLPGQQTRPTVARVREALFNIWQGEIDGCRWLDLCAGTGSMGAEALCRGASLVVGIEQSSRACGVIRQNWQQVAQPHQEFQAIRGDAIARLQSLAGKAQFDRIYFDPPYASNLYRPILEAIARTYFPSGDSDTLPLLAPSGELAVEQGAKAEVIESVGHLQLCRHKIYGNTALCFYCFRSV